jgi:thymidylate synthase (FAD)
MEHTTFPAHFSEVHKTPKGTPFLREPGVCLLSKPDTDIQGMWGFLSGFEHGLEFSDYVEDPTEIDDGAQLVKAAGQACYASFGPKRTKNDEASKYLTHIKESGHGSVLEHANYSVLLYGVSRSLTHELVRHRAGFAFSQLSQRYVSGRVLRFVERPEYQNDPALHERFCARIDAAAEEYEFLANALLEKQAKGDTALSAERKTDLRKKVQQTARSCLPNETETFLVVTANVRAWRHACEMRANEAAETEIRGAFVQIFNCLKMVSPLLFEDYSVVTLGDGTRALSTQYRKV